MNRKKAEQVFHELVDRNCGRWSGIARCYAAPATFGQFVRPMKAPAAISRKICGAPKN